MRSILSLFTILIFSTISYGQKQILSFDPEARIVEKTAPTRTLSDEGAFGCEVEYSFPGAIVNPKFEGDSLYQSFYIEDFSILQEAGLPAIPAHIDFIIVPNGSDLILSQSTTNPQTFTNFTIYPALKPASDEYGAGNPTFEINQDFYNSNTVYPSEPVKLIDYIYIKGIKIAMIQVSPIQFNPAQRKVTTYSKVKYNIRFQAASSFLGSKIYSNNFLNYLINIPLNNIVLKNEVNIITSTNNSYSSIPNYLIITHQDYIQAADTLAAWKEALGFNTEIISSTNWTSSDVKNAISSRYQSYNPSPDYFVILGDNDKVPGQTLNNGTDNFASDLYYSCMDGTSDFGPDMAYGRISVANATQALEVVKKIIGYEKNPVQDSSFYKNGLNAAYFQHASNGYEERRFVLTSEEIRNYMISKGYNVERVYTTESTVYPTFYNNGLYAAGEPIPAYLQKPTFAWTGNSTNINSGINEGRFYVVHRDHGFTNGWGDPYYTTAHVNNLLNGNKLPVVFSVNCLTGKYMDAECFSEKFLRKQNGGAVGIFGHGEVSYSGYNDGLSLGIFDAIWSNPGLVPTFSGTGGNQNPSLTAHNDIYTMGDVKNQGLLRMVETWGGTQSAIKYTFELFNYFGDPSMKIYTAQPVQILASFDDTLNCSTDTSLTISNSNFDGLAVLTLDDKIIAKEQIVNGSATLYFPQLYGTKAALTISKHNTIPLTSDIVILGGCPKAHFSVTTEKFCLEDSLMITNLSTGYIQNISWQFDSTASMLTSNSASSFYIKYFLPGQKTINLTITDTNGISSNYQIGFYMDSLCRYSIPSTGNGGSDKCTGVLYDDGGELNYSDNTYGLFTISPQGASSINLNFENFNLQNGADFIKIYDGPNTNSPLIGTYTGSNLPGNNGFVSSSTGSLTISQSSDAQTNNSGFRLTWECVNSNQSPVCEYFISDSVSCNGYVQFTDYSLNGPTNWLWDFGDGTTSNQQNPLHFYSSNGIFTVKLIVSNYHGQDSIIKQNLISVNRPSTPTGTDVMRCKDGSVVLSSNYTGQGNIKWFDSMIGGNLITTSQTLTTPVISSTTTYYGEIHENSSSLFTGRTDNLGTGNYYTSSSVHYLVFDCYKPVKLRSVKVYSGATGNRVISLLNSSGSLIMSKTVNIPAGENRVVLDFDLPVGTNMRLAASGSPNLYRNNDSLSMYPYNLQDNISIKYSSATTAPTNYYYFFYDWEIIEGECVSDRFSATAIISDTLKPLPNYTITTQDPKIFCVNQSSYGNSWYWSFGDGGFSILGNPIYTYLNNGTYQVTLTASNACGNRSLTQEVTISTASINTNPNVNKITVFPNPSDGNFSLELNVKDEQKCMIELYDISGKLVMSQAIKVFAGNNEINFGSSKFSSGVYTLKIISESGLTQNKLIIY